MQNNLQNHPKGQIYPVLTVGWHLLSDFVVKGWKSDFCHSSRVKIELFPKKKRIELTFEYLTNKSRYPRDVFSPSFSEHDPVIDSKYINLHASSVHLLDLLANPCLEVSPYTTKGERTEFFMARSRCRWTSSSKVKLHLSIGKHDSSAGL